MSSLTNLDFTKPRNMFPFIGMAAWAYMVTCSHRATEGLVKLLTVTDLYKLKSQVSVAMTEEAELVMQDAWKTMEHLIQASQAQGQKVQERQFQKKFWKSGHQVDFLIKKNWNCIQEILEQFSADCQSPSDADTQPQARKVKDFLTDTPATMALLQNRRVNIGQICLAICFLRHVFSYSAPCAYKLRCCHKEYDQKAFLFSTALMTKMQPWSTSPPLHLGLPSRCHMKT